MDAGRVTEPVLLAQFKENMEARMKYADQPDKFMESEVDLDEDVRRLQAIAGNPELYPELIRLNAIPSLLNLLSHENADIAGDVIELLNELTDSDVVEDSVLGLAALQCTASMVVTHTRARSVHGR